MTAVFVELGAKGLLKLAGSLGIKLEDELKLIQIDKKQATDIPCIYAAGDICSSLWQFAKPDITVMLKTFEAVFPGNPKKHFVSPYFPDETGRNLLISASNR